MGPRGLRRAGLAAVLLVVAALPASASAAWNQPVGGASPINQASDRNALAPSAAAVGGVPHVAWSETDGTNSEIRVARLNAAGTAWEQPWSGVSATSGGINKASNREAIHPSLADVGGIPYVAWRESDGTNEEIRVARLNGAAWEQPWSGVSATSGGINQASDRNAFAPSLAVVGGVPHVAWSENDGQNEEVRVARLNGSAWQQVVGGASPVNQASDEDATNPSLTAVNGVPHVAWQESDGTNYEIRVARPNAAGTDWEQPWTGASATSGGINQSTTSETADPSLTAVNGVPHVAWAEFDGTNRELRVSRLNGTTWEQPWTGVSATSGGINQAGNMTANDASLAEIGGVPYLAFREFDGTTERIRASRLNTAGTAWQQVVPSTLNERGASLPSLAAVNGVPHVAFEEFDGSHFQLRVARLEPEFTGGTATPAGTGAILTADLHTYGIPYPVGFQVGPALESETPTEATPAGAENVTVTRQVDGLTPATDHQFRPFATAGAPEPRVLGATGSFTTLAAPPGAGGAGTAGPDLELGGKRKQELPKITVTATCADKPCELEATGKLALPGGKSKNAARALKFRPASADAPAGEPTKLKLKLARKALKVAKRALDGKDRAKATIAVTATDADGESTTRTRKVTVVE